MVHDIVKRYADSVGMVINNKKRAIQLNFEMPLPRPLQEIPGMDDKTYKYICFEMMNSEVGRRR